MQSSTKSVQTPQQTPLQTQMKSAQKKKQPPPFWIGGLSSVLAACCTHPLDLLKARQQTVQGKASTTAFGTIRNIFTQEGPLAFYNGITGSLLRQATYSTTRFAVYDYLKQKWSKDGQLSYPLQILAAVLGGVAGGIAGTPADITNVRMQCDGKLPVAERRNYKHAFDGLIRITREEGPKALATGLGPNTVRAMLMTTSQVASYDIFKQKLHESTHFKGTKDDISTHFTASLLAGLVATTVCSPADVVKTRVMNAKAGEYSGGAMSVLTGIVKKEGVSALFKGWGASFVRLGPHTILTFIFYEQIKNLVMANRA